MGDGGEGGIRTLDTLRHTAFRERPVQPLLHLSIPCYCNIFNDFFIKFALHFKKLAINLI